MKSQRMIVADLLPTRAGKYYYTSAWSELPYRGAELRYRGLPSFPGGVLSYAIGGVERALT
jgi:hypothetical protein